MSFVINKMLLYFLNFQNVYFFDFILIYLPKVCQKYSVQCPQPQNYLAKPLFTTINSQLCSLIHCAPGSDSLYPSTGVQ